jgi:ABC-type multidrug transport system permease subunit
MITDRTTAKALGLVALVVSLLVLVSCFLFARPETRQNPRFPVVVLVSSLPMFAVSAFLFLKASRMKEDAPDERGRKR